MEMTISSRNTHPKWWQLYLTFPLLIALFVLDSHIRTSTRGREFLQTGIVLLVYGLIHLWLKANHSALTEEVPGQSVEIYKVIEIPPARSPELEGEKKSILQLSNSEIHGLLENGMKISYTDAEIFSNREIHKK
jgi:hypothetical protein